MTPESAMALIQQDIADGVEGAGESAPTTESAGPNVRPTLIEMWSPNQNGGAVLQVTPTYLHPGSDPRCFAQGAPSLAWKA